MKAFFLKFLIVLTAILGTYLLGAHHYVKWSYIAAFWGIAYFTFYGYHKWWTKDWENQKGRMKRIVYTIAFLPFMGIIFNVGTAFYHGPQEVFVTEVNDISTKGMDAKVLHPYGKGSGWFHPDLPVGLKVISDTEVQMTKEDGTTERVLISDMFPDADTSRIINNQALFWWKFDSSGVSQDLSTAKSAAKPATIFLYGQYFPMPSFIKKALCPQYTVQADGKEVPAAANCEWAQYNVITVHDGGPYRIIYVTVTYLLLLIISAVVVVRYFRKAKTAITNLKDDLTTSS
ncbi:MAG: hypothetical protein CMF61_01390 [Magnetococcales bacterium]|nr:hypothetical protein [Magnetococcales bacterium]